MRRVFRGPHSRATRLMKRLLPSGQQPGAEACSKHSSIASSSPVAAQGTTIAEDSPTAAVQQKTLQDLPGPPCWPVIGNLPMYLKKKNQGRLHEALVSGDAFFFKYLYIYLEFQVVFLSSCNYLQNICVCW